MPVNKQTATVIGENANVNADIQYLQTHLGMMINATVQDASQFITALANLSPQQLQTLKSLMDSPPEFQEQLQLIGQGAHIKGRIEIVRKSSNLEINLQSNQRALEIHYRSGNSDITLTDLETELKKRYRACNHLKRVLGEEVSFEDCYVNLSIVDYGQQQQQERKMLTEPENIRNRSNTYRYLYEIDPNAHIELSSLFLPRTIKGIQYPAPQRILLIGRPGTGKTTLCQKIAYDWAQGRLWPQFKAVIWLKLRELHDDDFRTGTNLADVLKAKLLSRFNSIYSRKNWATCLTTYLKDVLFLLDGFDEFQMIRSSHCKDILAELLQPGEHHVILTSRPAYRHTQVMDFTVETMGFSEDNVRSYVQNYFKVSPEKAISLLSHLDRQPVLSSIAHIPINLELMCATAEDWTANEAQNFTLTGLYQQLVNHLWLHYLKRPEVKTALAEAHQNHNLIIRLENPESRHVDIYLQQEQQFLASLAWQAHQADYIMLPSRFLDRIQQDPTLHNWDRLDEIKHSVFLTTAVLTAREDKRSYYFVHHTFQEFFAAKYIVDSIKKVGFDEPCLLMQNQRRERQELPKKQADSCSVKTFIQQFKYHSCYEGIWSFVAGILRNSEALYLLNEFYRYLQSPPLDLVGFKHIQLLIRCLNESQCHPDIEHKKEMLDKLNRWILNICSQNKAYHFPLRAMEILLKTLLISNTIKSSKELEEFFLQKLSDVNRDLVWKMLRVMLLINIPWKSKFFTPIIEILQHNATFDDSNAKILAINFLVHYWSNLSADQIDTINTVVNRTLESKKVVASVRIEIARL